MLSQDKEACLPCCQKHILPLICRAKQQQGPLSPLETCICLFVFSAGEESLPLSTPPLGWVGPTLKLVSPPPRAQFTVFLCGYSQPVIDDAS